MRIKERMKKKGSARGSQGQLGKSRNAQKDVTKVKREKL